MIVSFKANAIIKINFICPFDAYEPLSEFDLFTEYDVEIACHQGAVGMIRLIFDTFWLDEHNHVEELENSATTIFLSAY